MKSHRSLGRTGGPAIAGLALLAALPLATLAAGPVAAASPGSAGAARAHDARTVLASVATDGTQANLVSQEISVSADGREVAFVSAASNLVAGDTNDESDVFVHDRTTGVTQRVSVTSTGQQAGGTAVGGGAYTPSMSADGRYVVFTSGASDLVPGDTNQAPDVFVRDLRKNTTTRVSVGTGGTQADTRYISSPTISAHGRYVAFVSSAADLVPGDVNGNINDVFVHDLRKNTTRLVSVASDGEQQNQRADESVLSANGRFVAFESFATNLVPGDTNGLSDIFVHDLVTGTTVRASVGPGGVQAVGGFPKFGTGSFLPSISGDGQVVAFQSYGTNLVADPPVNQTDAYAHNLVTGVNQRIAVGPGGVQGDGFSAQVSTDGRYVAFISGSADLVAGDTNGERDAFVRDLLGTQISRVSVGVAGQGDQAAYEVSIGKDVDHVAFASSADNLVPNDTDQVGDVFLRNAR